MSAKPETVSVNIHVSNLYTTVSIDEARALFNRLAELFYPDYDDEATNDTSVEANYSDLQKMRIAACGG